MPGGARQLSVAAVRAPAQVPSPRGRLGGQAPPGAVTRVRSGPSSRGRRRGDVRTPARLVVALSAPRSRRGTSVQPVERTSNVRCPVSGCPVFRCPDGQACAVRGNAAARSASRWTWSGRVWGAAGWAQGVEVPPVSAGGWSPASGLTGSDGAAVGRAGCPRSIVAQGRRLAGVRLRRRLAAGPTRAGPGPGCRPGGEPGTQQVLTGPPAGRLGGRRRGAPTMGLDQEVVTTLGGR
jgi:hypothetical protein